VYSCVGKDCGLQRSNGLRNGRSTAVKIHQSYQVWSLQDPLLQGQTRDVNLSTEFSRYTQSQHIFQNPLPAQYENRLHLLCLFQGTASTRILSSINLKPKRKNTKHKKHFHPPTCQEPAPSASYSSAPAAFDGDTFQTSVRPGARTRGPRRATETRAPRRRLCFENLIRRCCRWHRSSQALRSDGGTRQRRTPGGNNSLKSSSRV
jgi:hypothetical protein